MIKNITIKKLRGIREGILEDLEPLTILVGPNGSGKSTVLEALAIGASSNPGDAIAQAVLHRITPDSERGMRWLIFRSGDEGEAYIGVESHTRDYRACHLSLIHANNQSTVIRCKLENVARQEDFNDEEKKDGESVSFNVRFGPGNEYSHDHVSKPLIGVPDIRQVVAGERAFRFPFHTMYTRAVEMGRQKEVRDTLAAAIDGVQDVQILTEGDIPVLYLTFETHALPAAMVSDGIRSMTRLVLEMATRKDGVVTLEEPEVHQHPGSLRQTTKVVWAAVRRGIQVVISTHSLELIDALLSESTKEDLEKMALYRLLLLENGEFRSTRVSGPDAAFSRAQIEDDLR